MTYQKKNPESPWRNKLFWEFRSLFLSFTGCLLCCCLLQTNQYAPARIADSSLKKQRFQIWLVFLFQKFTQYGGFYKHLAVSSCKTVITPNVSVNNKKETFARPTTRAGPAIWPWHAGGAVCSGGRPVGVKKWPCPTPAGRQPFRAFSVVNLTTKLWSISAITAERDHLIFSAIQDEIFDKAFPSSKVPLVPPPSIWAQRGIVVSLNWISKVKKMRPITENGTGKTPKKRQHTKRGQKAINGVKKTITKVSQICTIFIKIIILLNPQSIVSNELL